MKITRRQLRKLVREMAWSGFVDNEKKRIANPPDTDEVPTGGITTYGFPGAEASETKEELSKRREVADRYFKSSRTEDLYKKYFSKMSLKDINIHVMPYIGSPLEFFANIENTPITDDNLYDGFSEEGLKPSLSRQLRGKYKDSSTGASIIPTYGGGDHGSVWESGGGSRVNFIPFDSDTGKKIFEFFDAKDLNLGNSDTVVLPLVNEFANQFRPTPWMIIHAITDNYGAAIDGLDPNNIFGGDGWRFKHMGVSKSFRDDNIQGPPDVASEFITSAFFFGDARYRKDKLRELSEQDQIDFADGIKECNLYAQKIKEKMKGNIVLYVHY